MVDELLSGFTFIGLPLVRQQLGLSYEQLGLIFSVATLTGMLIEPPIYLLSDRGSKRCWISSGLLVLAAMDLLMGVIPIFPVLLVAFALSYPASGAAVGLSQAALIDAAPGESARTMTRWTMLSSIGDLLSPLAVTTILAVGLGWTGLRLISAGCWLAVALILLPQRIPRPKQIDDQQNHDKRTGGEACVGILQGLRLGLRDPILLRWAALDALTFMLDEIFLTFAVLYMRDVLHASALIIGIIVALQMLAGFLSLIVLDRLLGRVTPVRLLAMASWLTLVGVIGLLAVHMLWFAALSLVVIGLGSACFYPIVAAEAYKRQPGRSGTVRAITGLGLPLEIVLPGLVGLIASQFGPLASLGFLGIAPVLFLLIAPRKAG